MPWGLVCMLALLPWAAEATSPTASFTKPETGSKTVELHRSRTPVSQTMSRRLSETWTKWPSTSSSMTMTHSPKVTRSSPLEHPVSTTPRTTSRTVSPSRTMAPSVSSTQLRSNVATRSLTASSVIHLSPSSTPMLMMTPTASPPPTSSAHNLTTATPPTNSTSVPIIPPLRPPSAPLSPVSPSAPPMATLSVLTACCSTCDEVCSCASVIARMSSSAAGLSTSVVSCRGDCEADGCSSGLIRAGGVHTRARREVGSTRAASISGRGVRETSTRGGSVLQQSGAQVLIIQVTNTPGGDVALLGACSAAALSGCRVTTIAGSSPSAPLLASPGAAQSPAAAATADVSSDGSEASLIIALVLSLSVGPCLLLLYVCCCCSVVCSWWRYDRKRRADMHRDSGWGAPVPAFCTSGPQYLRFEQADSPRSAATVEGTMPPVMPQPAAMDLMETVFNHQDQEVDGVFA